MFTRLDAERNGKILKRAVNEGRLSENSFSVIIEHMDDYVSLPSKRLAHIVRRYSHHRAMKDIGKLCMVQELVKCQARKIVLDHIPVLQLKFDARHFKF